MDGDRFDAMTRALGASRSRRGFLRTLAGGLAAAVTGAAHPVTGEAAGCGKAGERCGCCKSGLTCTGGTCCPNDRVCNGACCPSGHTCQNGTCVRSGSGDGSPGGCPAGQAKCGRSCVDITTGVTNCGGCGLVCPVSTNRCQVAVCANGVCGFAPVNEGQTCPGDGNLCFGRFVCDQGSCVGIAPVGCAASDDCHVAGECIPATGLCSNPNAPDETSCNDSNLCTEGDSCQQGVCQGGTAVTCTASGPCVTASCDPTRGCVQTPKAAGAPCGDGNACNGNEACDGAGACLAGTPVTCPAPDQCHQAGVCDPVTGECRYAAKANGTICETGNRCTTDTCQAGACVQGDDVVSPTCTASDQCHSVEMCDPGTGLCTNPDKANGATCDDGNACTGMDTCQGGVCTGGDAIVCETDTPCLVASCDPTQGCVTTPKPAGAPCADTDRCDGDEACDGAGACVTGTPVTCPAPGPCQQAGVCDAATGLCTYATQADGIACDDGDNATCNDTCQAGVCTGAPCPAGCAGGREVCGDVCCQADEACNRELDTCGSCQPEFGIDCAAGYVCTSINQGHCVPRPLPGTCGPQGCAPSRGYMCNEGCECTKYDGSPGICFTPIPSEICFGSCRPEVGEDCDYAAGCYCTSFFGGTCLEGTGPVAGYCGGPCAHNDVCEDACGCNPDTNTCT